MPISTDVPKSRPPASRRWIAALTAMSGLVAAAAVAATPVTAHAGTYCGQDPDPDLGNYAWVDNNPDGNTYLRVLHLLTTPQQSLYVTDSRALDNRNSPVASTFTAAATAGQTFMIASTAGLSASAGVNMSGITQMFSSSVSTTVTSQVTSSTSAQVQTTVPAWGRAEDDYGVVVYYVQYNLDTWQISGGHCWYKPDYRSPHNVSGYVPTTVQEWRTTTYPIINPYGVVPSQYPSVPADDIHAGTVVTLYGQYYKPADQVIVQQGGASYTIQAGSAWWYDSTGQINMMVPSGLQPGPATVNVIDSQGLISNTVTINILSGPPS